MCSRDVLKQFMKQYDVFLVICVLLFRRFLFSLWSSIICFLLVDIRLFIFSNFRDVARRSYLSSKSL